MFTHIGDSFCYLQPLLELYPDATEEQQADLVIWKPLDKPGYAVTDDESYNTEFKVDDGDRFRFGAD